MTETDPECPTLSDAAPSYKRDTEFLFDNGAEDSSNEANDTAQYDVNGRRVRALCLHEIIAVYPVGTPLLHSAVGRYFSSFNVSLDHLNNVQAGWQGWHLLQDTSATMSHIMSTAGFLNHPAFASTKVREQLPTCYDYDVLYAQAQAHLEEEYDARAHAAGKCLEDCPFDPTGHKEQVIARAQFMRQNAEDSLNSTTWCLRDALASMCVHMRPRSLIEGECNTITCLFANAPQRSRVIQPGTGREMYKCHRGQLHSYMVHDVKEVYLKAERRRAKAAKCMPRSPLELLRSAQNTLDLMHLQDGGITAIETNISFLDMPADDWDILYKSRAWIMSTEGQVMMNNLRRQIPLWKFFTLFARMLGSRWNVESCRTYFPFAKNSPALSYSAAPSFVAMHFLKDHVDQPGYRSRFDMTMPKTVWEEVMLNERQLIKSRSQFAIAAP